LLLEGLWTTEAGDEAVDVGALAELERCWVVVAACLEARTAGFGCGLLDGLASMRRTAVLRLCALDCCCVNAASRDLRPELMLFL
jgi:hypothetical protein